MRLALSADIIESNVSARLDRLPWTRWHSTVVIALGITWLLDGLETTMGGAFVGVLKDPSALGLTDAEIGLTATGYMAGAVTGALIFGYLTDRLGRRKLFFLTLSLYLAATAASAFSWDFWSFTTFRAFTGAGIGGEYAAINSAVDELVPARVRGRVDLIINSTFWIGAAFGSLASILLLNCFDRLLLDAAGSGKFPGPAANWTSVRQHRTPGDDILHLQPLRHIARHYELALCVRPDHCPRTSHSLVRDIAAATLMVAAGFKEWWHGVAAERKSLESITAPLSAAVVADTAPQGS